MPTREQMQDPIVRRAYRTQRWAKIHADLIARFGGKCEQCCSQKELQFDHRDPSTKEFEISMFDSVTKTRLEAELLKCQLLCRECHATKTQANQETGALSAHGTTNRYLKHKCRCDLCRAVAVRYMVDWRRQKKAKIRKDVGAA